MSGNDSFDPSWSSNFYDVMKTISLDCSNAIQKFAGRIIKEPVDVLSVRPQCGFDAVAIGSIARREATPYSDLEYSFLIESNTQDSIGCFETLAMITYFLMGNL